MKDSLFKNPQDPVTPEDESDMTRRLAEAYQKQEEAGKSPQFQRILERVAANLSQTARLPTDQTGDCPDSL
jgi:hypothetical protein